MNIYQQGRGIPFQSAKNATFFHPRAHFSIRARIFGAQLSPSYLSQYFVENCNPRNVSLPVLNWLELKLINTKLYI